uniref:Transmembrane protein 170A n=1 Tax=Equus caballus TaxID=9796 RepID=A0A9L0SI85_HORSE|nr:PREDICTED: transmembrane protein 170A isoform X2 [Equus przewalskii]XP_023493113.1 transmembrane protein 170A isoform X3 [Equus caballus]
MRGRGPETCRRRRVGLLTAVVNEAPVISHPPGGDCQAPFGGHPRLAVCYLPSPFPTEMWYGVFLWALVSSLFFHVPAGLLALFTLRHHKYGAAIAGVYRAAGKEMIPFEALTLGTGQTFCVVVVSFLRILATL